MEKTLNFCTSLSPFSDTELAGYFIPKDTHVLSNLYAIHMDPQLWQDPDLFDPDRFLRNGKVHKPDCFIPFSVGKLLFFFLWWYAFTILFFFFFFNKQQITLNQMEISFSLSLHATFLLRSADVLGRCFDKNASISLPYITCSDVWIKITWIGWITNSHWYHCCFSRAKAISSLTCASQFASSQLWSIKKVNNNKLILFSLLLSS